MREQALFWTHRFFFFNSSGRPVYANDDANGTTLQSTLPAVTRSTSERWYLLSGDQSFRK